MEVPVVPTFAPITRDAPINGVNTPVTAAVSTIASAADDDCISNVSTAPASTPSATPHSPTAAICSTGKTVAMLSKASRSAPSPKNSTPKPAAANPRCFQRPPRRNRCSNMPKPISGSATTSTRIFKPISATIQAVMVVPTLLPNTTHAALRILSMPALVNPSVVIMTALEDCTNAVSEKPVINERIRVCVERSKMVRSESPAAALRPSVIMLIPSSKNPMPPRLIAQSVNVMFIPCQFHHHLRLRCEAST